MDDLEIVRKCAEAMRLRVATENSWERYAKNSNQCWIHKDKLSDGGMYHYDPLTNKAQAFELVEHFKLDIVSKDKDASPEEPQWGVFLDDVFAESNDLKRAICECVAKFSLTR